MHLKTPESPRIKKARMSKSESKAMLIVFFDINGIVLTEWVPQGQTINQTYYLSVLATLRERVRKKRPELWKNNSWILHQDNGKWKKRMGRCVAREGEYIEGEHSNVK